MESHPPLTFTHQSSLSSSHRSFSPSPPHQHTGTKTVEGGGKIGRAELGWAASQATRCDAPAIRQTPPSARRPAPWGFQGCPGVATDGCIRAVYSGWEAGAGAGDEGWKNMREWQGRFSQGRAGQAWTRRRLQQRPMRVHSEGPQKGAEMGRPATSQHNSLPIAIAVWDWEWRRGGEERGVG